jgi:hypothetical protein
MIVPGLVAMVMMVIATMLTSLTIAREWERGTMEQLAATPVSRVEVIAGKLLPYLGIGLIDVVAVVAQSFPDIFFRNCLNNGLLPIQVLLTNLIYDAAQTGLPLDRVDPEAVQRPIHWDMRVIERTRKLLAASNLKAQLAEADVLAWQPHGAFDAIYEQTCLCALYPDRWRAYADRLHLWLAPSGRLFALFVQMLRPGAPSPCMACSNTIMRAHSVTDAGESSERGRRSCRSRSALTTDRRGTSTDIGPTRTGSVHRSAR